MKKIIAFILIFVIFSVTAIPTFAKAENENALINITENSQEDYLKKLNSLYITKSIINIPAETCKTFLTLNKATVRSPLIYNSEVLEKHRGTVLCVDKQSPL